MTDHPYPTRELNDYLRKAGLGHLSVDEETTPTVSELGAKAIAALGAQVRQVLEAAQREAPPIDKWEAAAEKLLLDDDGTPQAQEQQDRFWRSVSVTVFAAHALIRLGDLSVFPLFIEQASGLPGHPQERAIELLRRYVDPGGSLSVEELVEQARAWWQAHAPINNPCDERP